MPRTQEITGADGRTVRRKPREGDLRWDGKRWHRWNGQRWVTAAYSRNPERLLVPKRLDLDPPISDKRRRKALERAVEDEVADHAASVVLDGPTGVILGYRARTNHLGHAIMMVLTAGLWAPIWVIAAMTRRERRIRLSVDDWGNVWATHVTSA